MELRCSRHLYLGTSVPPPMTSHFHPSCCLPSPHPESDVMPDQIFTRVADLVPNVKVGSPVIIRRQVRGRVRFYLNLDTDQWVGVEVSHAHCAGFLEDAVYYIAGRYAGVLVRAGEVTVEVPLPNTDLYPPQRLESDTGLDSQYGGPADMSNPRLAALAALAPLDQDLLREMLAIQTGSLASLTGTHLLPVLVGIGSLIGVRDVSTIISPQFYIVTMLFAFNPQEAVPTAGTDLALHMTANGLRSDQKGLLDGTRRGRLRSFLLTWLRRMDRYLQHLNRGAAEDPQWPGTRLRRPQQPGDLRRWERFRAAAPLTWSPRPAARRSASSPLQLDACDPGDGPASPRRTPSPPRSFSVSPVSPPARPPRIAVGGGALAAGRRGAGPRHHIVVATGDMETVPSVMAPVPRQIVGMPQAQGVPSSPRPRHGPPGPVGADPPPSDAGALIAEEPLVLWPPEPLDCVVMYDEDFTRIPLPPPPECPAPVAYVADGGPARPIAGPYEPVLAPPSPKGVSRPLVTSSGSGPGPARAPGRALGSRSWQSRAPVPGGRAAAATASRSRSCPLLPANTRRRTGGTTQARRTAMARPQRGQEQVADRHVPRNPEPPSTPGAEAARALPPHQASPPTTKAPVAAEHVHPSGPAAGPHPPSDADSVGHASAPPLDRLLVDSDESNPCGSPNASPRYNRQEPPSPQGSVTPGLSDADSVDDVCVLL